MSDDLVKRYSQRANPAFEAIMSLRSASKEGAFFLPYLHPSMRVLDVGCGPGSITLGFADVVSDGDVVGIDFQPSQIAQAQAMSIARKVTNIHFEVANVYELPFADASFDAVFAHALLWHLDEPHRALAEISRVLRPGGIVGIRDGDWGGRIYAPATPRLDKWFELTVKIRQHNGGDPFFGRKLRRLLHDSGFFVTNVSVSAWSAGDPEEIRLCSSFLKAQLNGFAATALAEGWIDQPTLDAVALEIDSWSERPDAFYVDTYCEAIGRLKG